MTQRERTMATVLGGLVVLGAGFGGVFWFVSAKQASEKKVEDMKVQLEEASEKLGKFNKQTATLERWRRMSFTGDPDMARAAYKEYLTNLIRKNELNLDQFTANPADSKSPITVTGTTVGGKTAKIPLYTGLNFAVKFKGKLANVVAMLREFQAKDWMHRVSKMTVERATGRADSGLLNVQATFEVLMILDADKHIGKSGFPDPVRFVAMDLLASLGPHGPANLGAVRWKAWRESAQSPLQNPINPLLPTRDYDEIGRKSIFTGPVDPGPTQEEIRPQVYIPDEQINLMKFTTYTQWTHDGDRPEGSLWNAFENTYYRVQARGGFKNFPLVQTVQLAKIIQGTVVKIEDSDIIFRVTVQADDAKAVSSKWWRYPLQDNYYTLHDEDVKALVASGKAKEGDKDRLYIVGVDYWASLTRQGSRDIELLPDGQTFRVVLTGAYGEIVQSDKEAVVLRMDSWPSGSKAPDTPVIPYSRFYPDKEVIYSVATKHFNDLLANKKVKAGDIERVYVVNKKYWDDVLWGQRIIFPEGESFRSYADLLSGDIIHRNDQVVIFRLDEKYCHCRGDKDLGIKDRWHEGFLVLHMGQQVQNSLMYPLPENRLKEFMPKGEAGNRD